MTNMTSDTIAIQNAIERLRQEKETFEQRRQQEDRWFSLRLRMGYTAIFMLPSVAAISGYIILNSGDFSTATITAATGALFVDVFGLMAAIWKVVLNPESVTKLNPVTDVTDLDQLPGGGVPQLEHQQQGADQVRSVVQNS